MEYNLADGWTPNPGYQPVDDEVVVDVKFKGAADENLFSTDPAGEWYWFVDGDKADILVWRLHNE